MVLANCMHATAEQQLPEFGWDAEKSAELLLDSSGGSLRRFFSDSSGSRGELRYLPGFRTEENGDSDIIESPVTIRLQAVSDVFSLNRQQLAVACRVTRRALYSWLDGAEPRRDSLQRIGALHRAALDWQRSDFPQPKASLQLPLLKQRSLLDLLTAELLDLDAIHFVGMRMKFQETVESTEELKDPFR